MPINILSAGSTGGVNSIEGVTNPGGNIDLVPSSPIIITGSDATDEILFSLDDSVYGVMISANDTTPAYLNTKLTSTNSTIALTEVNDGANETLNVEISDDYRPYFTPSGKATTVYVDSVAGSDSNDGLTAGTAWASIKKVFQVYGWANEDTVTVQLADGHDEDLPSVIIGQSYIYIQGYKEVVDTFTVTNVVQADDEAVIVDITSTGTYAADELRSENGLWTSGTPGSRNNRGNIFKNDATDTHVVGETRVYMTLDDVQQLNVPVATNTFDLYRRGSILRLNGNNCLITACPDLRFIDVEFQSDATNRSLIAVSTEKVNVNYCFFNNIQLLQAGKDGSWFILGCYNACAGQASNGMMRIANGGAIDYFRGNVIDAGLNSTPANNRHVSVASEARWDIKGTHVMIEVDNGLKVDAAGVFISQTTVRAHDAIVFNDCNYGWRINNIGVGVSGRYRLPNALGTINTGYMVSATGGARVNIGNSNNNCSTPFGVNAVSADDGSSNIAQSEDLTYIEGGSPTPDGYMSAAGTSADKVSIAVTGTPTVDQVQEYIDYTGSAGLLTGGTVSDAGGETIDIAAGTAMLRNADSHTAPLCSCGLSAVSGAAIATDSVRYVSADYNGGSPQYRVDSSDPANDHSIISIATVINEGGTLHILNNPQEVINGIAHISHRMYETHPFQRADRLGGLILGETGTRNVTLTTGELYDRLREFIISAIDTSGADTFDIYYRDGAAGFTKVSAATQWPNTQYDNNSGTLATMTNNWYSNLWFYLEVDGDLVMLYGQNQYSSLAGAETATPPATIPDRLLYHGRLIGRIIFQKSAGTANSVESVFSTSFGTTGVTDHANLASLQGGTTAEYYHLTSAQHTALTGLALQHHQEVFVSPGNDIVYTWFVPTDCTVTDIAFYAKTTPSSASGTYTFAITGAGNNLISTATYDLEGLSADPASPDSATLTGTTANLDLSADAKVVMTFSSNNVDLTGGAGLCVMVRYTPR